MMLTTLKTSKEIKNYKPFATDGELGKIHDFYFDDYEWKVRYLIIDAGGLLTGIKSLVSPQAIDRIILDKQEIHFRLSKQMIQSAPSIQSDKPISRQYEQQIHTYYSWWPYWGKGESLFEESKKEKKNDRKADPHLRSAEEVMGYHFQTLDGEMGHLYDFVITDDDLTIKYLIVDTKNWWTGRKVLISPLWVSGVSWPERKIHLTLSKESIEASPEYNPDFPINADYEINLWKHYGKVWE